MRGRWRIAVVSLGLCAVLPGCVTFYRPYAVLRLRTDWNTERQCSVQMETFNHLPLRPVRVRLAAWAYNPGAPGTPVPPRSGSPVTTVVPADAFPLPPPVPPIEDPSGSGIPQSPPMPAPPVPIPPPPPTTGAAQDLLDLARPPRLPSVKKPPQGADVLPNRPGRVRETAPGSDTGELGPTAQSPTGVLPSVYHSPEARQLVPEPEPKSGPMGVWLFQR